MQILATSLFQDKNFIAFLLANEYPGTYFSCCHILDTELIVVLAHYFSRILAVHKFTSWEMYAYIHTYIQEFIPLLPVDFQFMNAVLQVV
jgi:hypothetical protein